MTNKEYNAFSDSKIPKSSLFIKSLRAFLTGGLICIIAQGILNAFIGAGVEKETAASFTSMAMIFIGALLTGLNMYDNIAKFAGAGSIVPITGFANSIVAPAMEFKTEGYVTGLGAKMFVIAGPVLVYGISASVVAGIIMLIFGGQ